MHSATLLFYIHMSFIWISLLFEVILGIYRYCCMPFVISKMQFSFNISKRYPIEIPTGVIISFVKWGGILGAY